MESFTDFNGGLSLRTTLENSDPSALYPSLSSKAHPKDASFSSYLGTDDLKSIAVDDNWVMKTTLESAETTPTATKTTGLSRRINDTEISIFDAERYFNGSHEQIKKSSVTVNLEKISENGGVCQKPRNTGEFSGFLQGSLVPRVSSVSSTDGFCRNYRIGSFNATPTASSEASWNSQSGLLSNSPGSIAVSVRNLPLNEQKRASSSSKWLFGGKCPCSGKKSVDVKEEFSEPRNPATPICNSSGSSRSGYPLNSKKQENSSLTKELETLAMAEANKLKLVAGNAETEPDKLSNSDRYSPEIRFQAEIGRRIIPSGSPFNREDGGFSFPILNPPAGNLTGKSPSPPEERPRYSLEVFRPVDEASQRLQKRLISFSGDNNCRSFIFPASPKTRTADDDLESDSSSDLFEIDSFSTQTTSYPLYRRPDSLDEISSMGISDTNSAIRRFAGHTAGILHFRQSLEETVTPSECYEPSEVSVDWSVTTAEGFDRASVTNFSTTASEFSDARFNKQETGKFSTGGTATAAGNFKRRGNGLLSCRCEKAVNVAPHPVNIGQKTATGTLMEGEGAQDRPTFACSHSAHFSRPLTSR